MVVVGTIFKEAMLSVDIKDNDAFDVAVIGSGPGGQRAAIQAAKAGRTVCLIESGRLMGGAQTLTGTIPSKTMREVALNFSNNHRRFTQDVYGPSVPQVTYEDLMRGVDYVRSIEAEVVRNQLVRNGVCIIRARARFQDAHTLVLSDEIGTAYGQVRANLIIIAVGTKPATDPAFPIDGRCVITSDDLLELDELPRSILIYGGGVIGSEYATILASVGVRVILVDKRLYLMRFLDREITDSLSFRMNQMRVTIHLSESITDITVRRNNGSVRVHSTLGTGRVVATDTFLYCMGRVGDVETLGLEEAGVKVSARGTIPVDEQFRTNVPHILAVGDVIGPPALAATSFEQGRQAVRMALNIQTTPFNPTIPYGIYTIPEISSVGPSEQDLISNSVPYVVGRAYYREIARGVIMGDDKGVLKLIFSPDSLKLLSVHIMGERATDLIHLGQMVIMQGGTVDFFLNSVFNYPTLAECYKVAALDGVNRL